MPGPAFPTTGQTNYTTTIKNYIDLIDGTYNVQNPAYGATGLGVADDSTAIQAAVTAAGTGGTVYFPKGTYKTAGLTAGLANQTWMLAPGAVLDGSAATAHVITVTASGVQIVGPGAVSGGSIVFSGVFISAGLSDVQVLGVEIIGAANGVRCKGGTGAVTTRLRVDGCRIHGQTAHGVFFNWETTDSKITSNQIYSCGGNGIWVGQNSDRVLISENHISSVTGQGIGMNSTAGPHSTIIGNVINVCGGIGISIDTSDGTRVIGNVVISAGGYGLESAAANLCVFQGNIVRSAGSHGISISAGSGTCNDNLIDGNTFITPTGSAVSLGGVANGAKRTRVTNNTVIEAGNGAGNIAAMFNATGIGCSDILYSNNLIRWTTNVTSASSFSVNMPGATLIGNQIVHDAAIVTSGGTGINLASTALDCNVTGNTMVGNGKLGTGIAMNASCTGCLVASNKITGTTTALINNLSASVTNTISENLGTATSGSGYVFGSAIGFGNRNTTQAFSVSNGPNRFDGNTGFYGTTPIAQQTRAGQLTVAAGTPSTTTTVDVGATFSQTILNNQIATLATKLNALETIIHNLGLST